MVPSSSSFPSFFFFFFFVVDDDVVVVLQRMRRSASFFFLFCPFVCVFALSLDSSFSVVFFDFDSMKIFVFSFSLCVFVYVYVVCVFVEIRASLVVFCCFADLVLVLVVVQKVNVVSLRCLLVVSDGTKENLEELKGREGERRRSMIAKTSTAPLTTREICSFSF